MECLIVVRNIYIIKGFPLAIFYWAFINNRGILLKTKGWLGINAKPPFKPRMSSSQRNLKLIHTSWIISVALIQWFMVLCKLSTQFVEWWMILLWWVYILLSLDEPNMDRMGLACINLGITWHTITLNMHETWWKVEFRCEKISTVDAKNIQVM